MKSDMTDEQQKAIRAYCAVINRVISDLIQLHRLTEVYAGRTPTLDIKFLLDALYGRQVSNFSTKYRIAISEGADIIRDVNEEINEALEALGSHSSGITRQDIVAEIANNFELKYDEERGFISNKPSIGPKREPIITPKIAVVGALVMGVIAVLALGPCRSKAGDSTPQPTPAQGR